MSMSALMSAPINTLPPCTCSPIWGDINMCKRPWENPDIFLSLQSELYGFVSDESM